jgi:prophage regulatory protein
LHRPDCLLSRDAFRLRVIDFWRGFHTYSCLAVAFPETKMSQSPPEVQNPVAEAQIALFVRMAVVIRMTGLGRSTIYRLMAEDKFPPPVRLSKRAIAWRRADLERWSAARPTVAH